MVMFRINRKKMIGTVSGIKLDSPEWFEWLDQQDWFDVEEQGIYDEEVMGRMYKEKDGEVFKWYASRRGKKKTRVFELGSAREVTLERLLHGFEKIMRDEIKEDGGLTRNF